MPNASDYQPVASYDLAATIPSGQAASGTVDLAGCTLCGLFLPAAFTGTALTVTAAPSAAGSFVPVQDGAGGTLSLSVGPGRYVPLANLALLAGLRFVRLVSGSSEAADRTLTLAVRPV